MDRCLHRLVLVQNNAILCNKYVRNYFKSLFINKLCCIFAYTKLFTMKQYVRFTGQKNDYTFRLDISQNATGVIVGYFTFEGRKQYRVVFENGINATIDSEDLEFECKE